MLCSVGAIYSEGDSIECPSENYAAYIGKNYYVIYNLLNSLYIKNTFKEVFLESPCQNFRLHYITLNSQWQAIQLMHQESKVPHSNIHLYNIEQTADRLARSRREQKGKLTYHNSGPHPVMDTYIGTSFSWKNTIINF